MRQIIIKLLYLIISLLNDKGNEKLLKSHIVDGIKVKSESGWSPIAYTHETKPFSIYKLKTKSGILLNCADEHLIYTPFGNTVWAKDLKYGDAIITEYGIDYIESVIKTCTNINMCDITVLNENESYYSNHILSHNTTTSALFMLHYILFNIDKNALVLGNKRKTAVEILDKAKKVYLELPYFLKPGIYKWNEAEIVLDNGCRLMAEATTINSGISFTFHCVLADEFAHIHPNILDSFYNNLFPTITAGKAKFIITSTQNGYNLFYRLYKAAEAGENDYKSFVTTWDQVPEWNPDTHQWEKRDEEWHQKQVANYGSEEAFNRQFGTNFDLSADTLISQKVLSKRQPRLTEFIRKDLLGVPLADNFFWHPDYDPMTMLKNDYIITTADLSEGGGGDYTVLPITRMINPGTDDLETIGYFSSNKVKREDVAQAIQILICKYMNMEHSLLSFELNTYGDLFLRCLQDNVDKCLELMNFDLATIIKYYNDEMTKFKYGIKITGPNKKVGCMLFKESFERDEVKFNDAKFMTELTNFTNKGNGKYEAIFGHDDLVMATIQLEFVKQTVQYRLLRNEFNDTMSAQLKSNMYSLDDFFFNGHSPSSIDFIPQGSEMGDYYNIEQQIDPNLSRLNKFNR